jgi:hypothetical protein
MANTPQNPDQFDAFKSRCDLLLPPVHGATLGGTTPLLLSVHVLVIWILQPKVQPLIVLNKIVCWNGGARTAVVDGC